MEHIGTYTVSRRGQLALPARARHRWGLDEGGPVEIVDLGSLVVLVPGGTNAARRLLGTIVTDDVYAGAAAAIDDADLNVS